MAKKKGGKQKNQNQLAKVEPDQAQETQNTEVKKVPNDAETKDNNGDIQTAEEHVPETDNDPASEADLAIAKDTDSKGLDEEKAEHSQDDSNAEMTQKSDETAKANGESDNAEDEASVTPINGSDVISTEAVGNPTPDSSDITQTIQEQEVLNDGNGEDVADASTVVSSTPTVLPKIVTNGDSNDAHADTLSRNVSVASIPSTPSKNTTHISFVKNAIVAITENKEAKKNATLLQNSKKALERLSEGFDSATVFEALRSAIESKITDVVVISLDCISKIFTFQLFEPIEVSPPNTITAINDDPANDISTNAETIITPPPKVSLITAAIETIANAFEGEGTDEKIEIQVVRALMASVLNEYMPPHGSSLLKAIRQIYNIFILSLAPVNQGIAQASLTQIVNVVFDKVEKVPRLKSNFKSSLSLATEDTDSKSTTVTLANGAEGSESQEPLTLQNLNNLNDEEERIVDQEGALGDENDLIIKDAFLLFRSMCKLSIKPLENDSLDMRSHAVRSKLISLHIIHSIIKEHIDVFLSKEISIHSPTTKEATRFVDAVRQYLCLSVSRNAASAISPVFEITLEIFWLIISNLRSEFKREIPVFLYEIYFPVAEMKTSTSHQKRYFLVIIQRLCNDPRAVIEFYLNYDCDTSLPNLCEKIADYLTKLALTRVEITPGQKASYKEHASKPIATYNLTQLPLLSISKLSSQVAIPDSTLSYPVEYALKLTALDSVIGLLRSLNSWAQKGLAPETRSSSGFLNTRKRSSTNGSAVPLSPAVSVDDVDEVHEFENLKQRKTALQDAIRQFNYKPKKGIDALVKGEFLKDKEPKTIAKFLLTQHGLDKAVIGEYLGEGDDDNIAIMHSFVDEMDFTNTSFVEAMRRFLQPFRLPGEAQKIDRFMLKFAEKYLDGNPTVFANADTAYVLAYSVILLNTDQHSKKVKNRMTVDDFIKNNRGIDNGNNLPDEFLTEIFNEISRNEIKLQSEQHAALISGEILPSQPQTFSLFSGRDLNREAYIQASKEISNKTDKLFKTLGKSKGQGNTFHSAFHVEHVRSIFDTLWMSFLAALTKPFKDYDDDDVTRICLEGLRLSIHIAAVFDLDYARTSFIGALVQFANLQNLNEIKDKNVDSIILLLKIAETNGDYLKESWRDVLTLISQVERLQLISQGIEANVLPDVTNARVHRSSLDSTRTTASSGYLFGFGRRATPVEQAQTNHQNQQLDPAIAQRITSTEVTVAMDKIFTQSSQLNGAAIIDFIRALTEVATEEIESSLDSTTPRTFSLQKVIDVCYYNMGRIRLEWTPIWTVMGQCFNDIGTKRNLSIVFFAIDSLRQLSVRFLDLEELSGFNFQKDFLSPFDYILRNSSDIQVNDMVLNCLSNLIQLKGSKIKSGWSTIFSCLKYTAQNTNEPVVDKTYRIVDDISRSHFDTVYSQDTAFSDLIATFRELAKNTKYQKISLHALNNIKGIVVKIAEKTLDAKDEDGSNLKHHKDIFKDLWYPALFSFNDVIMTGNDLEVRSRALNFLFDILVQFGSRFHAEFWDQICVNLLFPIFGVLSKHWEINQFNNHDDLSVWLSTTLIQALRNMIALFTHYFDVLERMLDGYLGLLISCICQENDTIARIGRSCFQQLITQNMKKFSQNDWDKITESFVTLFELTTAVELFELDPEKEISSETSESVQKTLGHSESVQNLNEQNGTDVTNDNENSGPAQSLTPEKPVKIKSGIDTRRYKNAIVVKCILQLLMIETLSELFEDEDFYSLIPYENLTKLATLLDGSFRFARTFNDDYPLRTRIWNAGIIDKLPNLLKQESSAAAVYISIMFKLYSDGDKISPQQKESISSGLIPMSVSIIERYVSLDDSTQSRNVTTWRPVVVEILQGFYELEEKDFVKHCPHVYHLVLSILDKSVPPELRTAMKAFFSRVGDVYINEEDK